MAVTSRTEDAQAPSAESAQEGEGDAGAAAARRVSQPAPHLRASDRRYHRHDARFRLRPWSPRCGAELKSTGNVAAAERVGRLIGERALAKGITKVVFDRGGNKYHGRVKALAEGARAAGLGF